MAGNVTDQIGLPEDGTLRQNQTNNSSYLGESEMDKLRQTMAHIQTYICPTLFLAGILGNTCVILTVSHPQFKRLSSRFILCALAVSDSILLSTNPFNQQFMQTLFGYDVRAISRHGCKLFFIMYRLGKISSSWFIVMIATERFLAVFYPLRSKTILRKRNIMAMIVSVYAITFSVAGVWTFSTEIDPSTRVCIPDFVTPENKKYHKALVLVAACLYSLIPFSILLTLTPAIALKLLQRRRRRREIISNSSGTVRPSKTTLMLTVVVISYVFWVTPITIVLFITFWTGQHIFGSQDKEMIVFQGIALIFEQINNSCNFIIYILFSTQFHRRFVERIKCSVNTRSSVRRENQNNPSHISTTSGENSDSPNIYNPEYGGIWLGPPDNASETCNNGTKADMENDTTNVSIATTGK